MQLTDAFLKALECSFAHYLIKIFTVIIIVVIIIISVSLCKAEESQLCIEKTVGQRTASSLGLKHARLNLCDKSKNAEARIFIFCMVLLYWHLLSCLNFGGLSQDCPSCILKQLE